MLASRRRGVLWLFVTSNEPILDSQIPKTCVEVGCGTLGFCGRVEERVSDFRHAAVGIATIGLFCPPLVSLKIETQ